MTTRDIQFLIGFLEDPLSRECSQAVSASWGLRESVAKLSAVLCAIPTGTLAPDAAVRVAQCATHSIESAMGLTASRDEIRDFVTLLEGYVYALRVGESCDAMYVPIHSFMRAVHEARSDGWAEELFGWIARANPRLVYRHSATTGAKMTDAFIGAESNHMFPWSAFVAFLESALGRLMMRPGTQELISMLVREGVRPPAEIGPARFAPWNDFDALLPEHVQLCRSLGVAM